MSKPRPVEEVIDSIVAAAQKEEWFGVPDLEARFKYVRQTGSAIIVLRRNRKEAEIPKRTLERALEAVRANRRLYVDGPGAFRDVDISHVNSVIYALLRLLPLNELIG